MDKKLTKLDKDKKEQHLELRKSAQKADERENVNKRKN